MGRGLSYEQGPPFGVPLRLFQLAPLFLTTAAVLGILLGREWLTGRWSPATLALTHLLTVGYLGSAMQGALLQMLPVVLGSPIPRAALLSRLGTWGLGVGTPLLAAGLYLGEDVLLQAALAALAFAWLPFAAGFAAALGRSLTGGEMDTPIRFAGISLGVTVATGLALAGGLSGLWSPYDFARLIDLHVGWGLFGWITVLVIGVAYQVVPMLQLTPPYPTWATRWLAWLLPTGLLMWSLADWFGMPRFVGPGALAVMCGGCLLFVAVTMDLQRRRRRKVVDATFLFWRLGVVSLASATCCFVALGWLPAPAQDPARLSLGLLFLVGFAMSIVNGMLYKIVPFLAWFHLQSQTGAKAGTIPNMREMIDESATRRHFDLHLASVCLLVPAPFLPPSLAVPGLLALAWTGPVVWRNLQSAKTRYLDCGGRL